MTTTYHPCMCCGRYTPENEARYLGLNERELWLCPDCDEKPTVTEITHDNIGLLRSGSGSLRIPSEGNTMTDVLTNMTAGQKHV